MKRWSEFFLDEIFCAPSVILIGVVVIFKILCNQVHFMEKYFCSETYIVLLLLFGVQKLLSPGVQMQVVVPAVFFPVKNFPESFILSQFFTQALALQSLVLVPFESLLCVLHPARVVSVLFLKFVMLGVGK
jgi:hypothetical protein